MSTITQRRPQDSSSIIDQRPLQPISDTSDTSSPVPASTLNTLLAFTAAMVCLPIGSYFLMASTIFKGNTTLSGGLAALVANVVLIAYIVVAYQDDTGEHADKKVTMGVQNIEGRKEQ